MHYIILIKYLDGHPITKVIDIFGVPSEFRHGNRGQLFEHLVSLIEVPLQRCLIVLGRSFQQTIDCMHNLLF